MTKLSNLRNFIITYNAQFLFLKRMGHLIDEWENAADHCFVEGLVADVCSDLYSLNKEDRNDLVKSAILHDWNKRNEREMVSKFGFQQYEIQLEQSSQQLKCCGYSERIIELIGSVGHLSLKDVENSNDVVKLLMHIIDSMTLGDKFVSLDDRINMLESAERYKELNESGRAIWGGKTFFQAMREIDTKILDKLCGMLKIETSDFAGLVSAKVAQKFGVSV